MSFNLKTKWIFLLVFSAFLALGTVWVWRASNVDIGLDVIQDSVEAPILVWSDNQTRQVKMSPIEERFVFSRRFSVVSPLVGEPSQNPSLAFTVMVPDIVSALSSPEQGWIEYGNARISQPTHDSAKLAWLGGPFEPMPVILKTPQPRQVEVWTWWCHRIVDLHHATENSIPVIAEDPPLRRFHAQVPRNALASLRLMSAGGSTLNVARLYIGAMVPILFTSNEAIPSEFVWGVGIPHYRNQWNQPIPIPFWQRLASDGLASFILFFGMWFILGWIGIHLYGRGKRLFLFCATRGFSQCSLTRFSYPLFFLFAVPPMVLQIFMLLCFYPACMSPDSFIQWYQAHEMQFTTHHSVLSSFLIRIITWIWDSPAAVALFQVLVMSGLIGYGFSLLWRSGVSRIATVIVYLGVVLFPLNLNYAIVIWKDVPYTLTLAALTLLLMHLCLDAKMRMRKWAWGLLGVCLGFSPFFRPNGIVVWLGIMPLLPLAFWPYRRSVYGALLTSIGIACLIQFGLFNLLSIGPSYSRSAYMTTARLAPLVYQDVPFSQKEYEFLQEVRSLEDRWNYQRITADLTIFDPKYNEIFAVEHGKQYRALLLSCGWRFPYVFLRGFYEGASSFFSPLPARTKELNVTHWTQLPENRLGLVMNPWFPGIHESLVMLYKLSEKEPLRYFLWRPGLWFTVVLAAGGFLVWRMKDCRYAIVYMPVIFNTFSVVLGAVAQDVRYQFPLMFCMGFLFVYAMAPKCEDDTRMSF